MTEACQGAYYSEPSVVVTNGVEETVNHVKRLIERKGKMDARVLTCFDCRGLGSSTAIHEAARRNRYMHVLVDLAKCVALQKGKKKCMELITRLEKQHCADPSFVMSAPAVVSMFSQALEHGATCLVTDCLTAISNEPFDFTSSRIVYKDDEVPRGTTQAQFVSITAVCAEIEKAIHSAAERYGGAGVLIQVANAHDIFLANCMPRDELLISGYAEYRPNRMGVLMLRALGRCLEYCIRRDGRIIWAFTGVHKGAGFSFNIPSLYISAVELSEGLNYFDVSNVIQALRSRYQPPAHDDPTLIANLKRLSGPPILVRFFLNSIHSLEMSERRPVSLIEALTTRWDRVEDLMITQLHDKYKVDRFDSEVAKFCCIAPMLSYAGQLRASMDTLHSSVLSLSDCGLLRVRFESGGKGVFFDRPYPLLLSLFVRKYGIPKYALKPLLRAMETLQRNHQLSSLALAEVALGFELHKVFAGGSRDFLLTTLRLERFNGQADDENPTGVSIRVLDSLAGVQLDDSSIYLIGDQSVEDIASFSGFLVSLTATRMGGELTRLFICISFGARDDESVRSELCNMVEVASVLGDAKTKTLCVLATPYGTARLNEHVSMSSIECGVSRGLERDIDLLYFGRDHKFWDSSHLHQLVRHSDIHVLSVYLLSLLNLRHIDNTLGTPGDCDILIVEHINLMTSRLRAVKSGFSISDFAYDKTEFATYVRVFFDGKPPVVLASCVAAHGLTGLSFLNAELLSDTLKLGLSEVDLEQVQTFATLYRQTSKCLSDPAKISFTVKGILECLSKWGTEEPAIVQIREFLKEVKLSDLAELRMEDLSRSGAPLGAKLALLNIVSCMRGHCNENMPPKAPRKRKIERKSSPSKRHRIKRKISPSIKTCEV